MLENLQMAQPGQSGDGDMEQALNELGDMIRKQQQLRDKTFKQGQDSRRDRMRGKQGDQSMGDLQQDQQGAARPAQKLQQELAKRGMGQGQRGERRKASRASRASRSAAGRAGRGRGRPRRSRFRDGRCQRPARRGQRRWRGGFARQALEALRKGAQSLARRCSRATARARATAPAIAPAASRAAAISTDPLGRPLHGREFGDDLSVKIPGEIDVQRVRRILEELRRRLADPQRPQIELDYIERLLKDY